MVKRKYTKFLFSLYNFEIVICKIKAKEKFNLNNCIIDFDNSNYAPRNDEEKFRFQICVPTSQKSIA
jgi:hypothetical protein